MAAFESEKLIIRQTAELRDYGETWEAMRRFVDAAGDNTPEELWLLQHFPVYTLGRAADPAHLLRPTAIPVVRSDRGGQVTYHAPGQVIAYTLFNLRRRNLGLRQFVRALEDATVELLAAHNIRAAGREDAPGVYAGGAKIASLGLRLRRGWIYHGLSLNVKMDLRPFADINPCGLENIRVTQMADYGAEELAESVMPQLADVLRRKFFIAGG